jgi:hypothetical protein
MIGETHVCAIGKKAFGVLPDLLPLTTLVQELMTDHGFTLRDVTQNIPLTFFSHRYHVVQKKLLRDVE